MNSKWILIIIVMLGIIFMNTQALKAENQSQKVLMIVDFENQAVLKKIYKNEGVSIRLTDKDKVSGKRALEVRIAPLSEHKNRWPSISFGPGFIKKPFDLANYTKISTDIKNVTPGLMQVQFFLTSMTYNDRGLNVEESVFIIPGGTTMNCNTYLDGFLQKKNDPSAIRFMQFIFPPGDKEKVFLINNIKAVYAQQESCPADKIFNKAESILKQLKLAKTKIDWSHMPAGERQKLQKLLPKLTCRGEEVANEVRIGKKRGFRGSFNKLKESLEDLSRQLGKLVLIDKQGFYAWQIAPYVNVYKTESPDFATPAVGKFDVKMAQDEFRDKTIMISSAGQDVKLQVKVETNGKLAAKAISVREALYYKVGKTEIGDVLHELEKPLQIPAGQSRQLWFRFDGRYSGLKAGTYNYTINLTDLNSGREQKISGKLTVWDFKLPSYDTVPIDAYVEFHGTLLASNPNLLRQNVRHMKMYGLNIVSYYPYLLSYPVEVDKDLNITNYDDSRLRKELIPVIKAWKEAPGNEKLEFSFYLFHLSNKLLKRKDIKFGSKEWRKIFKQWIGLIDASLNKLGIKRENYRFVPSDEENASDLISTYLPMAEMIKEVNPNIRVATNSGAVLTDKKLSFRFYKAYDVVLGVLADNLVRYPHMAEWVRQGGKEPKYFMYKCQRTIARSKNIYQYYRVFGWDNYKYGNTSTGIWTYNAQGGDPWGITNRRNENTKNYCLIVKHKDKDEILHSRRYEIYRQGIDDYRYLCALKALAKTKGANTETAADKLIRRAFKDINADVTDYSRCDKWRIKIAKEILKIKNN